MLWSRFKIKSFYLYRYTNCYFIFTGSSKVKAPPKTIDTGGGFFLEEEEEEKNRHQTEKIVHPPGNLLYFNKCLNKQDIGHFDQKEPYVLVLGSALVK